METEPLSVFTPVAMAVAAAAESVTKDVVSTDVVPICPKYGSRSIASRPLRPAASNCAAKRWAWPIPSPMRRITLRAMGRSPTLAKVGLDTIAFRGCREPERETGLAVATAGPASAHSFFCTQYRAKSARCRVSPVRSRKQLRRKWGLDDQAMRIVPFVYPMNLVGYRLLIYPQSKRRVRRNWGRRCFSRADRGFRGFHGRQRKKDRPSRSGRGCGRHDNHGI